MSRIFFQITDNVFQIAEHLFKMINVVSPKKQKKAVQLLLLKEGALSKLLQIVCRGFYMSESSDCFFLLVGGS